MTAKRLTRQSGNSAPAIRHSHSSESTMPHTLLFFILPAGPSERVAPSHGRSPAKAYQHIVRSRAADYVAECVALFAICHLNFTEHITFR